MQEEKQIVKHGAGGKTAFLAIRELIVSGRLAPGSWIVEADLSNRLGLSRTPIRAGLQWLLHEGYVVARGSGAKSKLIVAPMTLQDAMELYAIVGHMEGIAGRRTAQIAEPRRKKLVVELKKYNTRLARMVKATEMPYHEFADVDTSFHDAIVEAADVPRLLTIYNAIKPQTERYWRLYSSPNPKELANSIPEHNQIIEAIAAGDGKATERGLQINWEKGAERLAKLIAQQGERGNW